MEKLDTLREIVQRTKDKVVDRVREVLSVTTVKVSVISQEIVPKRRKNTNLEVVTAEEEKTEEVTETTPVLSVTTAIGTDTMLETVLNQKNKFKNATTVSRKVTMLGIAPNREKTQTDN